MSEPASAPRATPADASARRARRRGLDDERAASARDVTTERLRLIEFLWRGSSGVQPVLYLDRSYLH